MLYRSGMIVPRIHGGEHGAADQFASEDLDAFLGRLLDGAETVAAAAGGQANIPDAAKRCCCGSQEIVRPILDRKLSRKWRLAGDRGVSFHTLARPSELGARILTRVSSPGIIVNAQIAGGIGDGSWLLSSPEDASSWEGNLVFAFGGTFRKDYFGIAAFKLPS
jgi:putative intracellular protease/amidase